MNNGRREDLRLVTGRGSYTADHYRSDEVYGVFVRADRAHARIVSIDTSEALALAGVLGVYTSSDILEAGLNELPVRALFRAQSGASLKVPSHPVLAHEVVRFVGEPVVLVVGESEAIAQDGAELIAIDYADLPAVVEATDAIAAAAPLVHDDIPANIAMDYDFGDQAATQSAFASAAHVVQVTVQAQRIVGNPLEPKSCMASFDAESGQFEFYAPSQGTVEIKPALAQVFGVPPQSIRVHSRDVGGAFGVRSEVYPEYVAVMLAARSLLRPVKWIGTRSETILSDYHGRDARLSGSLALDEHGKFLGLQIEWLVNLGAYCSNAGAFINTAAAPTLTATNVYLIPAVHGLHRLVLTNTTPITAYRGAGRPNVAYLAERLVDEAARVTGLDRVELRRVNMIRREDFPFRTPMGSVYDSGDPQALLAQALKIADWNTFEQRRLEAKQRRKLRGIGCAVFIEPSGNPGEEEVAIRFDAEGHAHMYSQVGPSGQGHETSFCDLVAGVLGIRPDRITLHYNDPDAPQLAGAGSFGSRSALSHGVALRRGAEEVLRKANEIAAAELEVSSADLSFKDGRFKVDGTDIAISFEELVARRATIAAHPLDVTIKVDTATTFPSGAHVAEVEIDPETGALDIVSYMAVDDCGAVLNPMIVEGQLFGGLMQGIGQVVGEFCAYERETGQLLTGTFMDYYMPRADALPERVSFHDCSIPSPNNVLGVKGVGEAGTTGSIPALANAVINALGQRGVHHLDMPFTSNRLWAVLQTSNRHGCL